MRVLFLDDNIERWNFFKTLYPEAKWVQTSQECIAELESHNDHNMYELIFLDHDLGGEVYVDSNQPNTGMRVVDWLMSHPYHGYADSQQPIFVVHSWNAPAAEIMCNRLAKYYQVIRAPFGFNVRLNNT